MNKTYPPLVFFVITIYSLFNSHNLYESWHQISFEKYSWIALLFWLLPIPLLLMIKKERITSYSFGNVILGAVSILFGLVSMISSLNTLAYMGLAVSLAAVIPWSMNSVLWIASSIWWMPASGWYLGHQFEQPSVFSLSLLRILLAGAGSFWLLWKNSIIKK